MILEERLEGLLKEGISIAQIRETPMVLELTTQIVQYRIKKLSALGYDIKSGNLESLNGTRKDFEVTYGLIYCFWFALNKSIAFYSKIKVKSTLLATADPTAVTPPATAETLPLTRPTPTEGTDVTAVLVISKLFPPIQATPPIVAPTAPFVTLKRPPVTRESMPACCCGVSPSPDCSVSFRRIPSFPLKMCPHKEEKAKLMRPNRDYSSAETEGSDLEMQVLHHINA
ncbi:hypothetical protein IHE44_0012329 [Lamprotornis superbus]|uniref:Uncharacterized protein n=1 Tax=Lamprotornis superbus TaxID=245042 RepID=A0A835NT15_9PASS|nr:hypothetical protein IHE44_0012329 [Lamprotornis superbus]